MVSHSNSGQESGRRDREVSERISGPEVLLNVCPRSIYVHCCAIWTGEARFGASWRCYPRTRFLLAPGLKAEVFVRAEPKRASPVPSAQVGVQVAAAHVRDHVIAFFVVPLAVRFKNYVTPLPVQESADRLSTSS
ncbi:unnamed protein product, partial [Iphiclides podalirius]